MLFSVFAPHPALPDLLVSHLCQALAGQSISLCVCWTLGRLSLAVTIVCCFPSGSVSSDCTLAACPVLSNLGRSVRK